MRTEMQDDRFEATIRSVDGIDILKTKAPKGAASEQMQLQLQVKTRLQPSNESTRSSSSSSSNVNSKSRNEIKFGSAAIACTHPAILANIPLYATSTSPATTPQPPLPPPPPATTTTKASSVSENDDNRIEHTALQANDGVTNWAKVSANQTATFANSIGVSASEQLALLQPAIVQAPASDCIRFHEHGNNTNTNTNTNADTNTNTNNNGAIVVSFDNNSDPVVGAEQMKMSYKSTNQVIQQQQQQQQQQAQQAAVSRQDYIVFAAGASGREMMLLPLSSSSLSPPPPRSTMMTMADNGRWHRPCRNHSVPSRTSGSTGAYDRGSLELTSLGANCGELAAVVPSECFVACNNNNRSNCRSPEESQHLKFSTGLNQFERTSSAQEHEEQEEQEQEDGEEDKEKQQQQLQQHQQQQLKQLEAKADYGQCEQLLRIEFDNFVDEHLGDSDKLELFHCLNEFETNLCDLSELLANILRNLFAADKLKRPHNKYKLLYYIRKLYIEQRIVNGSCNLNSTDVGTNCQQQQQQNGINHCYNQWRRPVAQLSKVKHDTTSDKFKFQLDLKLFDTMMHRYQLASPVSRADESMLFGFSELQWSSSSLSPPPWNHGVNGQNSHNTAVQRQIIPENCACSACCCLVREQQEEDELNENNNNSNNNGLQETMAEPMLQLLATRQNSQEQQYEFVNYITPPGLPSSIPPQPPQPPQPQPPPPPSPRGLINGRHYSSVSNPFEVEPYGDDGSQLNARKQHQVNVDQLVTVGSLLSRANSPGFQCNQLESTSQLLADSLLTSRTIQSGNFSQQQQQQQHQQEPFPITMFGDHRQWQPHSMQYQVHPCGSNDNLHINHQQQHHHHHQQQPYHCIAPMHSRGQQEQLYQSDSFNDNQVQRRHSGLVAAVGASVAPAINQVAWSLPASPLIRRESSASDRPSPKPPPPQIADWRHNRNNTPAWPQCEQQHRQAPLVTWDNQPSLSNNYQLVKQHQHQQQWRRHPSRLADEPLSPTARSRYRRRRHRPSQSHNGGNNNSSSFNDNNKSAIRNRPEGQSVSSSGGCGCCSSSSTTTTTTTSTSASSSLARQVQTYGKIEFESDPEDDNSIEFKDIEVDNDDGRGGGGGGGHGDGDNINGNYYDREEFCVATCDELSVAADEVKAVGQIISRPATGEGLAMVPSQAQEHLPMSVAEQMKEQANKFVQDHGSAAATTGMPPPPLTRCSHHSSLSSAGTSSSMGAFNHFAGAASSAGSTTADQRDLLGQATSSDASRSVGASGGKSCGNGGQFAARPLPGQNLQVRRKLRVKIRKSKPILGIAIEGGFNVSGQLLPRIVCVHEKGAAYKCGKLRPSDLILEVNGCSTVNMTHDEIAETIAHAYYQDKRPYIEFLIGESVYV